MNNMNLRINHFSHFSLVTRKLKARFVAYLQVQRTFVVYFFILTLALVLICPILIIFTPPRILHIFLLITLNISNDDK